jgi:hypothetical protein
VMKTSDAQWAPWSDDPDGRLTGRGDGRISLCARIRALSRRLRADQGAAVFEPCVGRCVW